MLTARPERPEIADASKFAKQVIEILCSHCQEEELCFEFVALHARELLDIAEDALSGSWGSGASPAPAHWHLSSATMKG